MMWRKVVWLILEDFQQLHATARTVHPTNPTVSVGEPVQTSHSHNLLVCENACCSTLTLAVTRDRCAYDQYKHLCIIQDACLDQIVVVQLQ
jgi:hypothetical protein